ncbi:acetyl-CoA hydrolase/transferase C-terminal domain-containing protein, partial [Cribrihabitans sp. XS_ASV171]
GQVVSGVGGQFNFVEQAFALHDARAIIALPATREKNGKTSSNIRWSLDSTTVPRHMRDIVVTEYGVADLRGRSDAAVIAALVAIADSRFQPGLIATAQKAGKLPRDFALPEAARNNRPQTVSRWLDPHRDHLPGFPLGTDFDELEQQILPALSLLSREAATLSGKARLLVASITKPPHPQEQALMARMGYDGNEHMQARALRGALRLSAAV